MSKQRGRGAARHQNLDLFEDYYPRVIERAVAQARREPAFAARCAERLDDAARDQFLSLVGRPPRKPALPLAKCTRRATPTPMSIQLALYSKLVG